MLQNKLLCTFSYKRNVDLCISNIQDNFDDVKKIFIFYNTENNNEYYITFNVLIDRAQKFDNYIPIHRKHETNTLYTVNALNLLISKLNNGIVDKTFIIDWNQYKNTLFLSKHMQLVMVELTLEEIV